MSNPNETKPQKQRRPVVISPESELGQLIQQYAKELRYRDGGAASKETYIKLKEMATDRELIHILEEHGPPCKG